MKPEFHLRQRGCVHFQRPVVLDLIGEDGFARRLHPAVDIPEVGNVSNRVFPCQIAFPDRQEICLPAVVQREAVGAVEAFHDFAGGADAGADSARVGQSHPEFCRCSGTQFQGENVEQLHKAVRDIHYGFIGNHHAGVIFPADILLRLQGGAGYEESDGQKRN